MAQQMLQTLVVLSGKVDGSFSALGNKLLSLGNRVNGLSQEIIKFGKEATQEFVAYDDVMREIRALGGYDERTMNTLHEINKTIAQTSRYTMDQAAEAEVLMAQLGLGMKDIQTLLPSVMNMATAGNLQMADSLNYLYYTLNALDMPLEKAGTLSDQMAKTAAISAADIDTLGLSLQRLGSGAQFFAGGSSEVLAILGAISQYGEDMQGASAGTQLRNFMLTLLAPTMSKEKLMREMSMTEDAWTEFETYMDDAGINVTDTAAAMNELGLSMYDARTGQLKPMIQILGELDASLASLPEHEQNAMLGQLFGKRTTITALNLLNSLGTIIDYKKQIEGSDGFTLGMSELMDGGPGGALRELNASWDALKTTVGETISPMVEGGADILTGVVNSITNMDPAAMKGIAASLSAVAAAGPTLLVAGTAIKLLAAVATPGGLTVLTALAGIGLAFYENEKAEKRFKAQFGDMSINVDELTGSLEDLFDASEAGREEYEKHIAVLEEAAQAYEDASVSLSQRLLTAAVTGKTLTEDDKQSIQGLANDLHTEFMTALDTSFDASSSYLSMMWGGDEEALDSSTYRSGMLMLGAVYDDLIAEATSLGNDIGSTIGSAMDDGLITGDEYAAILEKIQQYNDAMAIFTRAEQKKEWAQMMYKYQNISWDSAEDAFAALNMETEAFKQKRGEENAGERAYLQEMYDENIRRGNINPETGMPYSEADKAAFFSEFDRQYEADMLEIDNATGQMFTNLLDTLLGQGALSDGWWLMRELYANGYLKRDANGNVSMDAADWARFLPAGADVNEYADSLDAVEDTARRLQPLLENYMHIPGVHKAMQMVYDAEDIAGHMRTLDPSAVENRDMLWSGGFLTDDIGSSYFSALSRNEDIKGRYVSAFEPLTTIDDWFLNKLSDDQKAWVRNINQLYDTDAILSDLGLDIDTNHPMREYAAAAALLYQKHDVDYYGDYVQTSFDPEIYRRTELPPLSATVDEKGLAQEAGKAGSGAQSALMESWGSPVLVADVEVRKPGQINNHNLLTMSAYAEGGRATEASIFGEAGPEWAIPEEHTDRVAALLNSARQAAGFTWGELIGRNGGLNAGREQPVQIVYSPVIYANDATGVENTLKEDKLRLERWMEERRMRDEVEVFA